jgi:hypothetical protein
MNLKNRQQLLGILAIVAVVLLVGDRLVFTPLTRSWKDRAARIAELKKNYDQGTHLLARDHAIREDWEHMRTNTLASEPSLAQGQMYASLNRWREDSRATVVAVTPHWKVNGDDYATWECHVDAKGNLATLTRFLYEVEKDPLGIKVDQAELASQDDRGAMLTLSVQVSGLELNPPMQ